MNNWFDHAVASVDQSAIEAAKEKQLQLTKPPGSLGRMEELAVSLCGFQGSITPGVEQIEIAIFAGDHGVAEEGVSAFPQAVTAEMVKNFIRGGAAISVLAKQLNAGLTVINAGTINKSGFDHPVVDKPVGHGTANMCKQPAMSITQCDQAMALGKQIVDSFALGTQLVIGGEMGIANTTSASALAAAYGVSSPGQLVGPGTGIDSHAMQHKLEIIEKSLSRMGDQQDPRIILAELGGFEIAALAGFFIAAAQSGYTILVDGFISSVAALAASNINPEVRRWMIFSHASAEPGHFAVMQELEATPLIDLGMRLGEGSGAAVAAGLLRSACALHNQMATFEQAGVSNGQ